MKSERREETAFSAPGERKSVPAIKNEIPSESSKRDLRSTGRLPGKLHLEERQEKLWKSCVSRFSSGGRAPASVFGLKLVGEREELPCIIENAKGRRFENETGQQNSTK